ncbi:uncharacterized protein LOC113351402 [Papaver somniferum]|uniref:uncharacterized protein LOC113351402 n=1 Tax=Papaver somniferum TaxID=3469 RepID=UPI000E7020C7|nr:uncharacterized protein LOC113351402 [Papaver somniferum]
MCFQVSKFQLPTTSLRDTMEGSTSTQTAKRDVFHVYCTVMPDGKKLKCNFCEKEISSGISRIKLHLAQQRGTVAPCMHVPPEVENLAKVALEEKRKTKRQRRAESDNEDSEQVYHNEPWKPVCGIDEEEPDFHAEEEQAPVTQKKKTGFLKNLFGRKNKNIHAGEGTSHGPRASVEIPRSTMRPSQPPRMSVDMGGQYNPSRDSQPSMAKFGKSKTCREKVDSSVGRFFLCQ